MNAKRSQIVVGVILFLIGIFLLVKNIIFDFSPFMFLFIGAALILHFVMRKKTWALITGAYLTWYSAYGFLSTLSDHGNYRLAYSSFFIVTAIVFFMLFYKKKKIGLVLPAAIVFWFGIFIMFSRIGLLYITGPYLFTFCLGMSFLTAFFIRRGFTGIGRWALYTGVIFVSFGVIGPVGFIFIRIVASVLFILCSAVIIMNAVRKK